MNVKLGAVRSVLKREQSPPPKSVTPTSVEPVGA
jgi:hypothetical protein